MTRRGSMAAGSPVLGLRPMRARLARTWKTPSAPAGVSAVNQTPIGKRYLVTGFVFFLLGGIMALLMRTQLAVPDNDIVGHELYNELFTMHGTTMLFLFAVPILEGAAVYLIPPMIGTRDLAFPRLGAFGYWCYLFGGILLYSSFFFAMVPDAGWTMYTPLSNADFSPGKNIDFWLIGAAYYAAYRLRFEERPVLFSICYAAFVFFFIFFIFIFYYHF